MTLYGYMPNVDRAVIAMETQDALRESIRENGDHLTFNGAILSAMRLFGRFGVLTFAGDPEAYWLINVDQWLANDRSPVVLIDRPFSSPENAARAAREEL